MVEDEVAVVMECDSRLCSPPGELLDPDFSEIGKSDVCGSALR